MKLMFKWKIHQDKRNDVMTSFAEMELIDYQNQQGPTIKILGRWHDVINMTGVAICETDDTEALSVYLMKWNAVCDFEIVPVLDDEEAHVAVRKAVSED